MRSVTFIALLFGSFLFRSSLSAQTYNEILGRPTDSAITMSILFDQETDVFWEYGINPGTCNVSTSNFVAEKTPPLEIDFTGLLHGTGYYYRTRYRQNGTTTSFQAGPDQCNGTDTYTEAFKCY